MAAEWDFNHLDNRKNQIALIFNQVKNIKNIISPEEIPQLLQLRENYHLIEKLDEKDKLKIENVIKALVIELY